MYFSDGGRGRRWNFSGCERCQNAQVSAQLLEATFLTCCTRFVPLRFVIVFPCWLNFSASPWAIIAENLPIGRSLRLRKGDYVMLSSDFCSHKCNHAPLAHLCSDELWEGAWGGIVSVLTLCLRQFQYRLPLLWLLQCSLPCENLFDTVMHHGSQCPCCVTTDTGAFWKGCSVSNWDSWGRISC